MKHLLILAPFLALCSAHPVWGAETTPNVLLIIADDQGFGDFGFTGNPLVRTPNLDRLAGESAVYLNFIAAAACSPTRSALFTGRDHLLTGNWGVGERAGLREDETRMPAFFKASGYHTMHVGKLDSAKVGNKSPSDFGWDDWLGCGNYQQRDPLNFKSGGGSVQGHGWTTDIWTDYAVNYIREHRDGPWFASVAYIIPHLPWVCDEKYSAPFVAQGCSKSLAACYGSIAQMDECIGRLLDTLKETGQDRRTIVIFLSDNGPTSPEAVKSEDELQRDEDWIKRNVAHLRGHKALVWENGDRVPLLVRWPEHIKPGERKQFGGVEDLLPTLLDLTGVKADVTSHQPFTGISLRASLDDASVEAQHPELLRMAIAGPGSPKPHIADVTQRKFEDYHLTLRGPRFKYHALPGGQAALYDIAADPGETTDVKTKFPEVTARMAKECRARWQVIIASGRAFTPENSLTK